MYVGSADKSTDSKHSPTTTGIMSVFIESILTSQRYLPSETGGSEILPTRNSSSSLVRVIVRLSSLIVMLSCVYEARKAGLLSSGLSVTMMALWRFPALRHTGRTSFKCFSSTGCRSGDLSPVPISPYTLLPHAHIFPEKCLKVLVI